ncbi:uncharacterized protein PRCAT00005614001 [Priceomyces carsonii]|uniref:uncharacterized protein n=1 Tax=Priceomyces carsonii TaxID=28549 RepID=UPI002EDA6B57|nr:unnamed protein product [Priceomyces carsonii]
MMSLFPKSQHALIESKNCEVSEVMQKEVFSPSLEYFLTPPSTSSSTTDDHIYPNDFNYYNANLNKNQFNLILINSCINLLKILYPDADFTRTNVRFFIIELLRRSKVSIHILQICCFYLARLIKVKYGEDSVEEFPTCPKQSFLALVILASKFSQDCNYSFKTWLKICGYKSDDKDAKYSLTLQSLRNTETMCLKLLGYNCSLHALKYENWCNILVIFGYDFIRLQSICENSIIWESGDLTIISKLSKWKKFLTQLKFSNLDTVKIDFGKYYNNQIGKKVFLSCSKESIQPSLLMIVSRKNLRDNAYDDVGSRKKLKVNMW